MAKYTSESTVAHQKQNMENPDADHTSATMPSTAIPPGRRSEARKDDRRPCSYETRETIEHESVVVGHGEAFALNRSRGGILLLMATAPHAKQLLEVHSLESRWSRTVSICEPRWVRPVQVESQEHQFLVGCGRIVGPCHYMSF